MKSIKLAFLLILTTLTLFINTWIKDVFVCENEMTDSSAYRLYYSTEYGIVKIDFSDDSYWELENIKWQ